MITTCSKHPTIRQYPERMPLFALLVAVAAGVVFAVKAFRPRPVDLVALGLLLLTIAWILAAFAVDDSKVLFR